MRPALCVHSTAWLYSSPPVTSAGTSHRPTMTSPTPTAFASRSAAARPALARPQRRQQRRGDEVDQDHRPLGIGPEGERRAEPQPRPSAPGRASTVMPSTVASVSIESNIVSPA